MFARTKAKLIKNASAKVELPPENDATADKERDFDRREATLNARIAAFEALVRRQAERAEIDSQSAQSSSKELEDKLAELEEIAARLEEREGKLAKLTADLRERENALAQKTRALNAQEEDLAKRRAEAEKFGMRLLAAREEIDEKERIFEERSRQTLDAIRRQKEVLQQLRKAA